MVSRRRLLQGSLALSALAALRPVSAAKATDRFLVIYWNDGGWDPAMLFDPHFESNALDRGACEEASISGLTFADSMERPSVRNFLENWANQTAFVNGIAVGSISHAKCTQMMLTGSSNQTAADIPTLIASQTGAALALPHLVLSGPRYPGELGAFMVPLSPTLTQTMTGVIPNAGRYSTRGEVLTRDYLTATAEGLAAARPDPYLEDYIDATDRLTALESGAGQLDIAADADEDTLVEKGISALSMGLSRSLIIEGSLPDYSFWDSHISNERQQSACYEHNFERLLTLMDRLAAASAPGGGSLLDRTTLLVLSEMGRTPVLNSQQGKDHWPYTSAMLVGAGVRGGARFGVSNEALVGQPIDLSTGEATGSGQTLSAAHFVAGVLQSFGLDPATHFPGVTPFTAPFSG
ncbi:MAG: DUF1501 domain-containing protein [Myxococcota bacterium]|nr:DUF1501 domain-containing protein [Myxococcota bacterium]